MSYERDPAMKVNDSALRHCLKAVAGLAEGLKKAIAPSGNSYKMVVDPAESMNTLRGFAPVSANGARKCMAGNYSLVHSKSASPELLPSGRSCPAPIIRAR